MIEIRFYLFKFTKGQIQRSDVILHIMAIYSAIVKNTVYLKTKAKD